MLVARNAWKSVSADGLIIVSIVRQVVTSALPLGRPVTSMRVMSCPRPERFGFGGYTLIRYWYPSPTSNQPGSVALGVWYVHELPDVHDVSAVGLLACVTPPLSVLVASPFAMYALQKMELSVRSER